jgi:hypothetical protein
MCLVVVSPKTGKAFYLFRDWKRKYTLITKYRPHSPAGSALFGRHSIQIGLWFHNSASFISFNRKYVKPHSTKEPLKLNSFNRMESDFSIPTQMVQDGYKKRGYNAAKLRTILVDKLTHLRH